MSSKLDQSLDEIAGSRRTNNRSQRAPAKARVSTGGVTKNTTQKTARPTKAPLPTARPVPATGESKIIVSNLPADVNEQQIKDYFSSTVGPVKRVLLNYNKVGRSVGVATIAFHKATSAAEAAKQYDGVQVDGKPMKIEVILGAQYVPVPSAPKTLGERIAQPKKDAAKAKAKPKSAAAAPKSATAAKATPAAAGGAKAQRKRGRTGRPKAKTADELDAEMSEYFAPNAGGDAGTAANVSAPAATNGGDAAMVDEVL